MITGTRVGEATSMRADFRKRIVKNSLLIIVTMEVSSVLEGRIFE